LINGKLLPILGLGTPCPEHLPTPMTDARYVVDPMNGSNFGASLDLFAPGDSVHAATRTGVNVSTIGTSSSAALTSGAAALYRELNPLATPANVLAALLSSATPNAVTNAGVGSPTSLLFSDFGPKLLSSLSGPATLYRSCPGVVGLTPYAVTVTASSFDGTNYYAAYQQTPPYCIGDPFFATSTLSVAKYSSTGVPLWFSSPISGIAINDLSVAAGVVSGVFGVGYTFGPTFGTMKGGLLDGFAFKLNLGNGSLAWGKQIGTTGNDAANAAIFAPSIVSPSYPNRLLVTGQTSGAFSPLTNAGGSDCFVAEFDAADGGDLLYRTHMFGTAGDESCNALAITGNNLFIAGSTTGTFPGQTSAGGQDAIFRLESLTGLSGPTTQLGTAGTDSATGISLTSAGTGYLVGSSTGAFPSFVNQGQADAFLASFDQAALTYSILNQFGTSANETLPRFSVTADDAFVATGAGYAKLSLVSGKMAWQVFGGSTAVRVGSVPNVYVGTGGVVVRLQAF